MTHSLEDTSPQSFKLCSVSKGKKIKSHILQQLIENRIIKKTTSYVCQACVTLCENKLDSSEQMESNIHELDDGCDSEDESVSDDSKSKVNSKPCSNSTELTD